jgi:hypothetical protein
MPLGKEDVALLESMDTPTVCNVIEIVAPERRGDLGLRPDTSASFLNRSSASMPCRPLRRQRPHYGITLSANRRPRWLNNAAVCGTQLLLPAQKFENMIVSRCQRRGSDDRAPVGQGKNFH